MDNEKLELGGLGTADAPVMEAKIVNPGKKRLTVMGVEFVYIYVFGIGCAFLGWVAENIARLVTQGVLDSRFHILPFLSPYALIPFAFQVLLGDPDDVAVFGHRLFKEKTVASKVMSNLTCLLLMYMAVFFGELVVGNLWDMLFGVQLWNYSNIPLHVTQYTGLIPAVGYGTGAYIIFRFVYKPVMNLMRRKMKFGIAKAICLTLGVLIVLDTFCMGVQIAILGEAPVYWSVKFW